MIYKVSEMTRDELLALARDGQSPESRWLASSELKLRGGDNEDSDREFYATWDGEDGRDSTEQTSA